MQSDLRRRLDQLRASGLLREDPSRPRLSAMAAAPGTSVLDAATNDTLGWSGAPLDATAPGGAGASRLVWGTHDFHRMLEAELAAWLGTDAALLFNSGYAANVGTISALAGPGDLIVSDELNHASIIDGCRLSRASVVVYPHLDLEAAGAALARPCPGQRWLITESYFSMDGDGPDLQRAGRIAAGTGAALYVDEAHACGVFGPRGAGRAAAAGVAPDVTVVTFGKAFGLQGAAVAGCDELRGWLYNRARSFVYSTAPSPALTSSLRARLSEVAAAEGPRARLSEVVRSFRAGVADLREIDLQQVLPGPIQPIVLGSVERALRAVQCYADAGILVQAIRPPTVPDGTARVRLTLKATFSESDVARLVEATRRACNA